MKLKTNIALFIGVAVLLGMFIGTAMAAVSTWQINKNATITHETIWLKEQYGNSHIIRIIDYQTGKIVYVGYNSIDGGIHAIAVTDINQASK